MREMNDYEDVEDLGDLDETEMFLREQRLKFMEEQLAKQERLLFWMRVHDIYDELIDVDFQSQSA